ncbi:M48 family metallopeptidase [Desulfomicrobium sp. ZS1]|uniref:M48 family metallopeptidase n=1 Tax=Desulfomicrobium sp. ZS1 TaxID=2952228 RepID=UPI0020B2EF65|nr:SprT-like domain-containing protein [Desulfomicrobium sp. ZS1]UTF51170.1 M48 family metallopeptidase [Desulfomicrobium sp. ZS1]
MHWQSIPVTVTRSLRARKVWLKMRSCQGIEVVLPYRVSASEVPSILERHRAWLLARLRELTDRGEAPGQNPLPDEVRLDFLDRRFSVRYEEGSRAELHAGEQGLNVFLPSGKVGAGATLLQMWLVDLGKTHLVPFCRELAAHHGVPIGGVQVRNQGGRWGSCSARLTISLNAKLLFLSAPLVRNVVLHELCHVAHRNHGPTFKAALRTLDPLTDAHEGQMRKAWENLPAWTKWRRGDGTD